MVASSSSGSRDGATSGRSRGGGGGGGSQQAVKKGPWTTAEDAILMEYVRKHGEGNWNAVQRNSGLLRCGKSCRLRWANHLRPNLKKGAFSPEEERLIIELHAKLGNKWARMASQLPGRTDNEIKNYWNTRVKRLQRAGLPIYPDDIPQPYDQPQQLQQQQRLPNSSSPSFSSLFSSPSPSSSQYSTSKFNPPLSSLFHPYSFPTMANPLQPTITSSFLSNSISNPQINLFRDNNRSSGGFVLPFSPSPSTSSLFNQSYQNELLPTYPPQPLQFKSDGFDISPPPPPPSTMGASFNPLGLVPGTVTELSSIQSPVPGSTTTASSGSTGGGDCMIGTPSTDADEYSINIAPEVGNSGLLDALLEESKALSHADKLKKQISSVAVGKGKGIWVSSTGLSDDAARGVYDSSSAHSSIGMKENDPLEEMNPMDDDLSSLLNNFPLTVPVPDWYDASATSSNGQSSSNMKDGYSGLNNLPQASPSPIATTLATTNPRRTLGSCCWNNMPDIC